MFKNDQLIERINQLKKELVQIVKETGFNSPDTLCCSQELDRYITVYQKIHSNLPKVTKNSFNT